MGRDEQSKTDGDEHNYDEMGGARVERNGRREPIQENNKHADPSI